MRIIWWLIQINAVVSVYLFYLAFSSDAEIKLKVASAIVLGLAALLEYFGYHRIHKPTR